MRCREKEGGREREKEGHKERVKVRLTMSRDRERW
jgi:hypothetical protein